MSLQVHKAAALHSARRLHAIEHGIANTVGSYRYQCDDQGLRDAFHLFLDTARDNLDRVEKIIMSFGDTPGGEGGHVLQACVDELEEIADAANLPLSRAAAMAPVIRTLKTYEASNYRLLKTCCISAGHSDAADLTEACLKAIAKVDAELATLDLAPVR